MKDIVTLSDKYQVVIPKAAREKMKLTKADGQRFTIERVTDDEIVFKKAKTLDDFLGKFTDAFPKNTTALIRHQRDTEWDR